MDATTTALIIAIVGVAGTLLAPIVSQRLSAHAKREEFELQRLQRQEEYDRERGERTLIHKRDSYISITSSSRRYRVELMNYLFAIKRGLVSNELNVRLEDARVAFSVSFAETQLIGALPVLVAVTPIRDGLSDAYRAIRKLETETSRKDKDFDEIEVFLLDLWGKWPPLHTAMRTDLGTED
jgi:hypothetical protein